MNATQRLKCIGCQTPLTPGDKSSDASFCRECFSVLQGAFREPVYLHRVIEKPIIKTETVVQHERETIIIKEPYDSHEERTRALTESKNAATNLAILNYDKILGLQVMLEQRDVEICRLTGEVRHLKKQVRRNGRP
jgi:hypothetical protein